jgi:hypothetical protein
MIRAFILAAIPWALAFLLAASCEDPAPVPPGPVPATGGAQPATGGAPGTGGNVGTGGVEAPEVAFCRRLAEVGCPEGSGGTACLKETRTIMQLEAQGRTTLDMSCVIHAKDKATVQNCGSVACGRIQ